MISIPFDIFIWRALAIFLLIGAVLGILLGLLLIFKPQLIEAVNRLANRWISTRGISRLMDSSISIERWFYRHHRAAGIFIMLGAAYIFIDFAFWVDKAATLHRYAGVLPIKMLQAILDSMALFALIASCAAFIAGLLICLRPSLLKGLEQSSNQWVSVRRATKVFDVPRDQVDVFVVKHAQHVGWMLFLGSSYLFFLMFRSLL